MRNDIVFVYHYGKNDDDDFR